MRPIQREMIILDALPFFTFWSPGLVEKLYFSITLSGAKNYFSPKSACL